MFLVHALVPLDHEDPLEERIKRSEILNMWIYNFSLVLFILIGFFSLNLSHYAKDKCISAL